MQNHYNLVYREEEREMMPTLRVREITSITSMGAALPQSFLIFSFFSSSPAFPIPSTLALALSRGPRSRVALSHAPWENAPSALITIRA